MKEPEKDYGSKRLEAPVQTIVACNIRNTGKQAAKGIQVTYQFYPTDAYLQDKPIVVDKKTKMADVGTVNPGSAVDLIATYSSSTNFPPALISYADGTADIILAEKFTGFPRAVASFLSIFASTGIGAFFAILFIISVIVVFIRAALGVIDVTSSPSHAAGQVDATESERSANKEVAKSKDEQTETK